MRDRIFILFTLLLIAAACLAAGVWISNSIEEQLDETFGYTPAHEHGSSVVSEHAVPHLVIEQVRKAANAANPKPIDDSMYEYLVVLGQTEANDLLVELVSGETRIPADDALLSIYCTSVMWDSESQLMARADFKEATLRLADSDDVTTRHIVATLITNVNWVAGIPKLRELLDDPNLEVRVQAASSLRDMTGEKVVAKRPPAIFPKTQLREGMIVERTAGLDPDIEMRRTALFLTWFDGKAARAHVGHDDQLVAFDARGKKFGKLDLEEGADDCFSLPRADGSIQIVSTVGWDEAEFVSFNQQGRVLWRRPSPGFEPAVLYSDKGAVGFAFPTYEDTLKALGLDGTDLWEMDIAADVLPVYSHPELPEWLLGVGDYQAQLVNVKEHSSDAILNLNFDDVYIDSGILLPSETGQPLAVLGGTRDLDGIPIISVVDQNGLCLWTAQVPSTVSAFALFEQAGKPKVIAAITTIGGIYLFDREGTLLYSSMMPGAEADPDYSAWDQAAGLESDGSWSLRVTTDAGMHLFEVRL